MTVCKIIPLEAIYDMNELTFHGNTKVDLIAESLLERLDIENRNDDHCRLHSVALNLHHCRRGR